MGKMIFRTDGIVFQPAIQNSIVFTSNSGLGAISEMLNKWLQKNPNVKINQLIYEPKVLLCLYECNEVVFANE